MTIRLEWQGKPLDSLFFDHSGCIILRKDSRKIILRFPTTIEGENDLFVKIYIHSSLKFSLIVASGSYGAIHDMRLHKRLQSRGIPVPELIGAVVKRSFLGLPKFSLYATRWIDSASSLIDFVRTALKEGKDIEAWLKKLCLGIGQFTANLHKKMIVPADFNAGNILVKELNNSEFQFYFIDYERIYFTQRKLRKKRVDNLAKVSAFMLPAFEDTSYYITEGYCQICTDVDKAALLRGVRESAKERCRIWKSRIDDNFARIARERHKLKLFK